MVIEILMQCANGLSEMDQFDEMYNDTVELYAHLAQQPGWVNFIRDQVKQKMQSKVLFTRLAEDVKNKIQEQKNAQSSS